MTLSLSAEARDAVDAVRTTFSPALYLAGGNDVTSTQEGPARLILTQATPANTGRNKTRQDYINEIRRVIPVTADRQVRYYDGTNNTPNEQRVIQDAIDNEFTAFSAYELSPAQRSYVEMRGRYNGEATVWNNRNAQYSYIITEAGLAGVNRSITEADFDAIGAEGLRLARINTARLDALMRQMPVLEAAANRDPRVLRDTQASRPAVAPVEQPVVDTGEFVICPPDDVSCQPVRTPRTPGGR